MSHTPLRYIAFGAHPDDCELFCGGLAARCTARGDAFKFVSVTNGNAGHHRDTRDTLKKRRAQEARDAGSVVGIEYEILDYNDGGLTLSLEPRFDVIRLIREWRADVVLSHRPHDYHPDHRYTGMAVQDAAYMVMVPLVVPDTPPLNRNPFFFYFWDPYKKPYAFQADVAVAVDDVMDSKWAMMERHPSQFFEWLPYVENVSAPVPVGEAERRQWLTSVWTPWLTNMARCCVNQLENRYGGEGAVVFAETFEICEYGRNPSAEDLERIFPR